MKKEDLTAMLVLTIVFYLILAFSNWSWSPVGWNGFSRFLFAFLEIIMITKNFLK